MKKILQWNSLKQRVFSALILLPLVLICVLLGGAFFNFLLLISLVILTLEFTNLISYKDYSFKKIIALSCLYLVVPIFSLLILRNMEGGIEKILYLCFIVWITDIGAYFGGNYLKGPKLLESVSPNKTISGALCGIVGSVIIGFFTFIFVSNISFIGFVFLSIFLSIISQIGDLFESKLKRLANVKDTSDLLPGHGGLLDRVDGLLFAAPCALLFFLIF